MIGAGVGVYMFGRVRRTTGIALNGSGTVDITVAGGSFTITVSGADHAHQNGTWGPFSTADLDAGPVMVVAPLITGTPGTGEVLTSAPGLWVFDQAHGATTIASIWQRDGVDIAGATGATHTTVAADEGTDVTYQETATNSAGARAADSNAIAIPVSSTFAVTRIGGFQSSAAPTANPGFTLDLTSAAVDDIIVLFYGTNQFAAAATVGGSTATKISADTAANGANKLSAFEYTVGAGEAGNAAVTVTFTVLSTTNAHVLTAHLVTGGIVNGAGVGFKNTTGVNEDVSAAATPNHANNTILACAMGAGMFTTAGDETWANATLIASAKVPTATTRDISIASQEDVVIAPYTTTCTIPLGTRVGIITVAISEAP